MCAKIQAVILLILLGLTNLACATPIDSTSHHVQPKPMIAQKSVPHIDTSKCIQNSASGWINMSDSGDDGIIGRSYNPGKCPANYTIVETSDTRVNHGILSVSRYFVRDTYAGKTVTCCPIVSRWVTVT